MLQWGQVSFCGRAQGQDYGGSFAQWRNQRVSQRRLSLRLTVWALAILLHFYAILHFCLLDGGTRDTAVTLDQLFSWGFSCRHMSLSEFAWRSRLYACSGTVDVSYIRQDKEAMGSRPDRIWGIWSGTVPNGQIPGLAALVPGCDLHHRDSATRASGTASRPISPTRKMFGLCRLVLSDHSST